MKFNRKFSSIILFAFILALSFIPIQSNVVKIQAATIRISSTSLTIEIGKTKTLSVTGTSRKVTWYSSKKSVATVSSSGKVMAKAPGTTTITASVAGKKLYSKITVKTPIKISSTIVYLRQGDSQYLKITGTSAKVTWYTSNKSVATVSSGGKVTGKAPGTATITAYVAGKKLYSKVRIKEPLKINTTSLSLHTGDSKYLKLTGTSSKISWYTSKASVAYVSSSGKVTAKGPGTATITASVHGKKLYCKVTVKEPQVLAPESELPKATVPTPTPVPAQTISSSTKVVGYYATWAKYSGFTPDKIDASKLTHINYAFANIDSNHKLALGYPDIDPGNIAKLNALKLTNPNLKTIIAVGGWTWSARFSDAALTDGSRAIFADSCVDFIVKYGFDGVDLDWEYPVSGGLSTNVKRPEDKQNFTLLLKTIREKLDARGKIDGKHYILTFAGAAGPWYVNNTELSKLSQYVDYVNLMTYDIHGSWEPYTNFNAPLYGSTSPIIPYNMSVNSSISYWLNAGFPKDKIVMGVPFYGFIYKAVTNSKYGLYQTYSGSASISYKNVAANYLNASGYIRHFHPDSKVPWLFNGSTFITYEDEQSMALKAQYIKEKGLGGAMIWELSQDPNRILLNSLYENLD